MLKLTFANWFKRRKVANGLARSGAEELAEVLVVTKRPLLGNQPVWLRQLTWQEQLPNFTDYLALIIEVPADNEETSHVADLMKEIEFAAMGGVLVIWLVASDSQDDLITKATGLPFIRLREPSPGGILRTLEAPLRSVVSEIESFHTVFQAAHGWVPLVTIPAGGASVIIGQREPKTGFLIRLALPISHTYLDRVTNALGEWVQGELRQRSFKTSGRRAVFSLVVALALMAAFTYGARMTQRRQNIAIEDQGYWGSSMSDLTYTSIANYRAASDWPLRFSTPVHELAEDDLDEQLAISLAIADHYREEQIIRFLLAPARIESSGGTVSDHLGRRYADAIGVAVEAGDFERARFLAQRFLNFSGELPYWTGFHQNFRFEHNQMRRIVDLMLPNYVYRDADLIKQIARASLDLYSLSEVTLPDSRLTDPSLTDNVEYTRLAAREHGDGSGGEEIFSDQSLEFQSADIELAVQEPEWRRFGGMHDKSEKRDEADFNHLNGILGASEDAVNASWQFLEEHRTSYLADDALFYVVRLSVDAEDWHEVVRAFSTLASDYYKSDSLKRIQYLMLSRRGWEPLDKKRGAIDEITSIAAGLERGDAASGDDDERERVKEFLRSSLGGFRGGDWNDKR